MALSLLLFISQTASAQPPTAPPPHPVLDDVVKEYMRLEMPLPPKDSELVRIRRSYREEGIERVDYNLAFRSAPKRPLEEPSYFIGWGRWNPRYLLSHEVEVTSGDVESARDLEQFGAELLCQAVQCKLRGWDALATEIYHDSLRYGVEDGDPLQELRSLKWMMGKSQLSKRGSDRKKIFDELKPLAEFDTDHLGGQFAYRPHLLNHLKLTIAPSRAKPGTADWLIDDLVNYWIDNRDDFGVDTGRDGQNEVGQESYFKLVEMGFDAVPALIEHWDDERYTYALGLGFGNFICRPISVGELAREIVNSLAGGKLNGESAKAAREWFAEAKKVAEDKYLLLQQSSTLSSNILRVTGVKYPKQLKELYLVLIRKSPDLKSDNFVSAILASTLTKKEKIALFEEGTTLPGHERNALEGLLKLDDNIFRKQVESLLVKNPGQEFGKLPLILWSSNPDRMLWNAYEREWEKKAADEKRTILYYVGWRLPWTRETDPLNHARIRFLLRFIHDPTPEPVDESNSSTIGDYAATRLAGILGFRVRRDPELTVATDQGFGTLERIAFRAIVAQAAINALEKKPM